jgi:hypothetical protein
VLTTIEPDGSVHAVPMWVAAIEDAHLLATGSRSRKVRNLERDPRATLVLHDSRRGAVVCGVSLRSRVELVRGPAASPLIERVHGRYISERGLLLPEVRDYLSSDDVALRFLPDAAVTWDERASSAAARVARIGRGASARPDAAASLTRASARGGGKRACPLAGSRLRDMFQWREQDEVHIHPGRERRGHRQRSVTPSPLGEAPPGARVCASRMTRKPETQARSTLSRARTRSVRASWALSWRDGPSRRRSTP